MASKIQRLFRRTLFFCAAAEGSTTDFDANTHKHIWTLSIPSANADVDIKYVWLLQATNRK